MEFIQPFLHALPQVGMGGDNVHGSTPLLGYYGIQRRLPGCLCCGRITQVRDYKLLRETERDSRIYRSLGS